jgi:DNA-binding LacI/PurR family transcriptional regulator/signal transduction histidine kinase
MKKRKTLGLIINCLDGNYLTYFWLMLKKAAEKFDCNLIVYEGRGLNSGLSHARKHTIVYGFVDKKRIDGLIITSAVTDNINDKDADNFLNRFQDIPLVSIGKVIPEATSIIADNRAGMKSLVKHLVEDHNYKKIMFVTGPKNNCEAVERYEAYLEVLEENNISVDEDIIFEGDFNSNTGYRIMKEVILKDIQYDVAVFSNDDMALGALKAIDDLSQKYGIDVSKKRTICGFDDITNAKLTTPSLTTVSQPFEEICENAIKALLDKIDGKQTEDVIKFPAVLVKRQSCGCEKDTSLDEITNKSLRLVPQSIFNMGVKTYNLNDIYEKITREFKRCRFRNCFISTYHEGTITYDNTFLFKESFEVPKKSMLLYAFKDGERVNIEDDKKVFDTKNLVPEHFIPKDRRFYYLINPLYFEEDNFGFLCFELVNDDVVHFESLRAQISNILNGALLLMEKDKIKRVLVESERLASLGHLVGGISHNLMSPVMSISGVTVAMESLIDEYEDSLEDPQVIKEDYIEILGEMETWNSRLKEHKDYMEKVISSINAQARELSSSDKNEFTVNELTERIKFNLNNNIKLSKCKLNVKTDVDDKIKVSGDMISLVKVIDNILINAVESYPEDEKAYVIDLYIYQKEDSIIIKIRDYGDKIPPTVKDKIFKHMITSKGTKGTGLSLLLSYSTIKAKFGGEMWFEEPKDKGVIFYISIPVRL